MTFLKTQGELALGSRFKSLSESLYAIANQTYRVCGFELDAHGFPLLRYLQVKGPASVTAIAIAIGQSHPAVSQLADRLHAAGWVARRADSADKRRSVLELTAKAEAQLDRLGLLWCAIRRGARAAMARAAGDFASALARFEADVSSDRIGAEILVQYERLRSAPIRVQPYRREWAAHFERINSEWLERHFVVEAVDRAMLADPQRHVIDPGGAILFARIDGEVIGTIALLKEAPGVYELSKMAVETGFRGLGAGRKLLDAAIATFRRRRGRVLFLESNAQLKAALTLYESAGFVHHPAPRPGSHYRRADVYMVYEAGLYKGSVFEGKRVSAAQTPGMRRKRAGRSL